MMDSVQNNEKLSVAALMSVILRRKISRTIDVKWLVEDETYARKIIALCREQGLDDLNEYSAHFETLMFGRTTSVAPPSVAHSYAPDADALDAAITTEPEDDEEMLDPSKYIGGLR